MSRSVPELIHELIETTMDVREHRFMHAEGHAVGPSKEECGNIVKHLEAAEATLLQAACEMHEVEGLLLVSSVRWAARVAQGQDPTQEEETPH